MTNFPTRALLIPATLATLYILGFFFLYLAFGKYVVGSNYHVFVAKPAQVIHTLFYQPVLEWAGPESVYTKTWLSNARFWCERLNGEEYCLEGFGD